jgi:hypothetical protein
MGLSFTIAAGPRQSNHSRVQVPRDSWPYFTVSDSRFPKPGGPGPRIYIIQEQGGPVIPPGTGFHFRCLLRLAGLRWRYSNPPPHGVLLSVLASVVLLITPLHGPSRTHRFQQYLYCHMCSRCRGNMFTEPLPINGSIRCNIFCGGRGHVHNLEGRPWNFLCPSARLCTFTE